MKSKLTMKETFCKSNGDEVILSFDIAINYFVSYSICFDYSKHQSCHWFFWHIKKKKEQHD